MSAPRARRTGNTTGTNQYATKPSGDVGPDRGRGGHAAVEQAIKQRLALAYDEHEYELMVGAVADIVRTTPYADVRDATEDWPDRPVIDLKAKWDHHPDNVGLVYSYNLEHGPLIEHYPHENWWAMNERTGGPLIDGHFVTHYETLDGDRPTRVYVLTALALPDGYEPEFAAVPVDVAWDGDTPHVHIDHGPDLGRWWWKRTGRAGDSLPD